MYVLAARRKCFNELQELKGNIRVFCRVRPASRRWYILVCIYICGFLIFVWICICEYRQQHLRLLLSPSCLPPVIYMYAFVDFQYVYVFVYMSTDSNIRVFYRDCLASLRWYILVYVCICTIEYNYIIVYVFICIIEYTDIAIYLSSAVSVMPLASDIY